MASKAMRRYNVYKARRNGVKTKTRMVFASVDKAAAKKASLAIEAKGKVAFNSMDITNAVNVTLVPEEQAQQDMSRSR